MMLSRLEDLEVMFLIWVPKVTREWKVIPKILVFFSKGMMLLMDTCGLRVHLLGPGSVMS